MTSEDPSRTSHLELRNPKCQGGAGIRELFHRGRCKRKVNVVRGHESKITWLEKKTAGKDGAISVDGRQLRNCTGWHSLGDFALAQVLAVAQPIHTVDAIIAPEMTRLGLLLTKLSD